MHNNRLYVRTLRSVNIVPTYIMQVWTMKYSYDKSSVLMLVVTRYMFIFTFCKKSA